MRSMSVNHADVMSTVVLAAAAIEAIAVGLLGVMLVGYSQYARGDANHKRPEILPFFRNAAIASAVVVFASSGTATLALLWLEWPRDAVYWLSLGFLNGTVLLMPVAS